MPARDGDIGARIDGLLAELASGVRGVDAAALGEQLVAELVDYYGEGLTRIVAAAPPELVHQVAADPLVESQLVLHGLHPLSVSERIDAALDRVRPYLGSHAGGVKVLGVTDDGIAKLRLDGSCHGCPSSTVTVQTTIEEAVLAAAPELSGVEVEGQVEPAPKLLQIELRPGGSLAADVHSAHTPSTEPERIWLHPSALDLPANGELAGVRLDGRQVLMTRLADAYLAYADACPACSATLTTGTLRGQVLTCGSCGARFDVRLAGKAVDGSGRRLEPLPLLDDVSGVRIALVPAAAVG